MDAAQMPLAHSAPEAHEIPSVFFCVQLPPTQP